MAGWSILANGSGLDSAENVGPNEENKNSVVVIVDDDDNHDEDDGNNNNNNNNNNNSSRDNESKDVRLRRLFDEVLSLFAKAIGEKGVFRPLPVVLDCEEKPVDLFRLFGIVRGRGGFGSVSKRGLWGFAARELGFRVRASASVKLVYYKYLSELEKWLVDREKFGGLDGDFRLLSSELEAELRGLLPEVALARPRLDAGVESGKECKRKRECFSEMLKWLKEMAKLSSGGAGYKSEAEENEGKELFDRAMRAREVLLLRRHVDSSCEECSSSLKKPKMHPSMYEDRDARSHHSSERLRCSKRVPNAAKSWLCACCNAHKPVANPQEEDPDDEPDCSAGLPPATEDCPPEDDGEQPPESRVSVGPRFQAEVPEWTACESSDPKWLGTRVWPPEHRDRGDSAAAGKGRRGLCRCLFPGSGECVRFHVAEARVRLKLELGPVFFAWRLHRAGEEVSLGWTAEEEAKFKDAVTSGKSLRDRKAWWWLPRRPRESLVSYYFNVFLVRKRSYQNRVTPRDIDSDDDEAEFGSVGGWYGNGPADLPGRAPWPALITGSAPMWKSRR